MKLRLTRPALRQIGEALDYIRQRSPQGAESVRQRLNAALVVLQEFAFTGQETDRRGVRRAVLSPYPYAIEYRVTPDEVVIMRLRHTARPPFRRVRKSRVYDGSNVPVGGDRAQSPMKLIATLEDDVPNVHAEFEDGAETVARPSEGTAVSLSPSSGEDRRFSSNSDFKLEGAIYN